VRARVVWALAAAVLLVLAFSSESATLYRLLFGLLAVPLLGYVGSVFSARRLFGEVRRMTPFLQVGETVEEQITLRNLHWFPKLLLESEHTTSPFGTSGRVLTLWPYSMRRWVTTKHCERRGLYTYGELKVTSRDPLGLFNRTLRVGKKQEALIYPATVDLSGFFVPAGHGWTEGMVRGRTSTPSPTAASVREYVPGDAVSHVHWRATARAGKLMVKEFEREPSGPADAVWVLLDLDSRVQVGEGTESTVEYAVHIAASVAKRFLDAGRTVGLAMNADTQTLIRPAQGMAQIGQILQSLALVEPGMAGTLVDTARTTASELTSGASVVAISAAPTSEMAVSAAILQGAGAGVVPVLIEASSFANVPPARGENYRLPGTTLDAYVIHKGDEIQRRLDYRLHGMGLAPVALVGETGEVGF
jgi:uncharacterized protein (DUF58 family)